MICMHPFEDYLDLFAFAKSLITECLSRFLFLKLAEAGLSETLSADVLEF